MPSGPIYSAADMLADPHFQARGLFEQVLVNGEPLKVPAIIPKLDSSPGANVTPAPRVGEHTEEVLAELLGLDDEAITRLRRDGVV